MIVCGLMAGGKLTGFTIASTGMLLYMACISAVAYSLWGILLKNNPVSKVSVYGFMNPVFGVLLAAWLLGETEQAFRWQSMAALICVSIGIYVVNRASPTSCTDTPSVEQ